MAARLRSLLAAAAAFVLCAFAMSCGRGDERTADGRLVIDYWEKWTGFERDAMEAVVDKYNESQDRVFVRFVSTSQIDRKLLLATAGGTPPDVAGFWSHSLVNFAEKGAIMPLDRLMERDGLSREDYIPSIYGCVAFRGRTWGLPSTPATIAMHYNKDLFRRAGLDPEHPPATLDEMESMCERLTAKAADGSFSQMGFVPTDPGWWGTMWPHFFGRPIVSDDGTELLCDSPENVAAFEWMQHWIEKYGRHETRAFEAAYRGEFASASNSFMAGRIALMLQGVWMASFVEEHAPDMDWGVAPFPAAVPGMPPATVVETDILVIPRGARHVEEAWEFIKFVQQQENMEMLCTGQLKFSPLRDVSERFDAEHPNPNIRLFRELAESPNARAVPRIPIWAEYRDDLAVAIEQMWVQGRDPKEALAGVKARVQPKLDKANRRWNEVAAQREKEWSNL